MQLRIKLFARLREELKQESLLVELRDRSTVAELRTVLAEAFPNQQSLLMQCRIAVNLEFVEPEQVLLATDELALIPPVSGG